MKRLLALASLCLAFSLVPISTRADVVTEWNTLALDAIRNESTSPPLAARNLAILHAAIYDAVNALDRAHEPYFMSLPAPPGASMEAAAVGAAYECLSDLYPSQTAAFDAALHQFLARTPATTNRADGLLLGQFVALEILTWRSADGSSTTVPYIPGTNPGDWRRTPPFFRPPELPQWPYVDPFALTNGAQFRPTGPPALTSTQYTRDFNQVKQLGALNSTNRTAEQTLIARFWSDFSYTVTPPGHWNQIAQNIATNRPAPPPPGGLPRPLGGGEGRGEGAALARNKDQNSLNSLSETARLFALLNLAMADAAIIAWDAKYVYNFWRPVTAIRAADTDDNSDTEADPNWTPLLNTPPFPEYISGHSAFSAAAATVLANFYGTDQIHFTAISDALPGVIRSYESLAATAEEIGLSRIYGGIHFLSADEDGLEAGQQAGEYVFRNFLRPPPEHALLTATRSLSDYHLQIHLTGTPGSLYVLETSTNLLHWTPVHTNRAPFTLDDPTANAAAARFYRAISR